MKKRRIKKLVKKYINAVDEAGSKAVSTRRTAINAMNASNLKTALLNVDGDIVGGAAVPNAADVFPNDAREQLDTDKDRIGDNRDIILTKVALDAIFQDLERGDVESALDPRPAGTLQELMDQAKAIQITLKAEYDKCDPDHDGNFDNAAEPPDGIESAHTELTTELQVNGKADVDIDSGAGELLVTVPAANFTVAGLNQLLADIAAQEAQVAKLQTEIEAMTATAGVTIDDIAGLDDYQDEGDSTKAKAEAAATGSGAGVATDLAASVTAAEADINAPINDVTPADSGALAMLNGIVAAFAALPPAE